MVIFTPVDTTSKDRDYIRDHEHRAKCLGSRGGLIIVLVPDDGSAPQYWSGYSFENFGADYAGNPQTWIRLSAAIRNIARATEFIPEELPGQLRVFLWAYPHSTNPLPRYQIMSDGNEFNSCPTQ